MFLHQCLIVKDPVHGIIDGQKINLSVQRDLIQNRSRKIVDKRISGQIDQVFLRQIFIQYLGGNKDVRNIAGAHLRPTIAGTVAPGIRYEFQFNVGIFLFCQFQEFLVCAVTAPSLPGQGAAVGIRSLVRRTAAAGQQK